LIHHSDSGLAMKMKVELAGYLSCGGDGDCGLRTVDLPDGYDKKQKPKEENKKLCVPGLN